MNVAEPAHSRFGGSVAARVLRCPASVGLVEKVPENLRRSSAYADRGTALHVAITLLLDEKETLESLAGKTLDNYTITRDDIELALRPVLAYVVALLDTSGAEFFLERRVTFPTIANTFGTCDLIIRIGNTIHVIDFKFGAGVLVRAFHPDGDEDVINPQIAFYAIAARHSLPKFFAGVDEIKLTILQPVSSEVDTEMESSVVVAPGELDAFVPAYRTACKEALSPTPRLERGAWCRFCAARPICPEHTKPLLDFARFAAPTPPCTPVDKAAYLQTLAAGLDLVDAVKDIRTALHDQAKRALEQGDCVPGYALSAGRAERHWRDEDATIGALIKLGLARGDVITETVCSPRQAELRARARGLKVPQELIVSNRSGVLLVRVENAHAPVPGRVETARAFSEALKAFRKEEAA
jgi:Protein of unknown function (DUF2800)